jgi:hypothetical protein
LPAQLTVQLIVQLKAQLTVELTAYLTVQLTVQNHSAQAQLLVNLTNIYMIRRKISVRLYRYIYTSGGVSC